MARKLLISIDELDEVSGASEIDTASLPDGVRDDIRWYFASGLTLEEMYLSFPPLETNAFFWGYLAKYANWARRNYALLSHLHRLAEPSSGTGYGVASWSRSKAILALRNPGEKTFGYPLDPEVAFELPASAKRVYRFREVDRLTPDFTASAGSTTVVSVAAHSVLVFEAIPAGGRRPTC